LLAPFVLSALAESYVCSNRFSFVAHQETTALSIPEIAGLAAKFFVVHFKVGHGGVQPAQNRQGRVYVLKLVGQISTLYS